MKCPRCATINQPGSSFCMRCGLQIAQPVPAPVKGAWQRWRLPLVIAAVIVGGWILAVVAVFVDTIKKKESASQTAVSASPAPAAPAPTPVPTFAELKTKADSLLAITQDGYGGANLKEFDNVMGPLREIPKGSKDHAAAQALEKKLTDKVSVIAAERILLGERPKNSEWDGSVQPVKDYLKANLNDYDSSEFVEWSPVSKMYLGKEPYWAVRLKLRAKNAFGGYILRDTYYFMRNNRVVMAKGLNGD